MNWTGLCCFSCLTTLFPHQCYELHLIPLSLLGLISSLLTSICRRFDSTPCVSMWFTPWQQAQKHTGLLEQHVHFSALVPDDNNRWCNVWSNVRSSTKEVFVCPYWMGFSRMGVGVHFGAKPNKKGVIPEISIMSLTLWIRERERVRERASI